MKDAVMNTPRIDTVTFLKRAHNLVDVASGGIASQSSISKWSKPNDAQRAVNGTVADFAFHTEHETGAWWKLDLRSIHFPSVLVISNRKRREYRDQNDCLSVKVSADGKDWTTVHSGKLQFGHIHEGIPLLLPLSGVVPVRHIWLQNEKAGYLHLASVHVLCDNLKVSGTAPGPVFLSHRSDGLGERLKAIVNAIALAGYYKTDFAFSWPPISATVAASHAIGQARDLFSDEFVDRRMVTNKPTMSLSDFISQGGGSTNTQALVSTPHTSIYHVSESLRRHVPASKLSEAFWKIGFSDKMQKAIDIAKSVELLTGGVGIHLRAGDIVYGRYRFSERYTNKVVPYPLCAEFVKQQATAGTTVILFGQDADLCRKMTDRLGAVFAGEYHSTYDFDDHQAAIFDIVLMSRCARVVSGNSGFAQIAQIIGQFELLDPLKILPPEDAMNSLRHHIENPDEVGASDLQRAFANWYAVRFYSQLMSTDEVLKRMREAVALDPANGFYQVIFSTLLFKNGKTEEATRVLEAVSSVNFQHEHLGGIIDIVNARHPDGTGVLDRYEASLAKMAENGVRVALPVLALLRNAAGDLRGFSIYKDRFGVFEDSMSRTVQEVLKVEALLEQA